MAAGVPMRWGRDQADSGAGGRRATPGARQWWLPGAAYIAEAAQPLPCLWFCPGPRLPRRLAHLRPPPARHGSVVHPAQRRYTLGIGPGDAVFAGDSYRPDYLGPVQAGMPSFLIDPGQVYEVPGNCRLASVFDVPAVLEANQGERRAVLRV
jgi:hypothetical protein